MFSYIHIPFCESKCKYCRFASLGSVNKILVKTYLTHLIKNIQDFKRPDWNTSGFLNSIYFWWWTPSILDESELYMILNTLQKKFWFEKEIEITLETTPKNITVQNILSWEKLWINRLSMWIQTLNDISLENIGRDKKDIILHGLELLKNSKIQNISVDFIIGLPYVKKWEILENIKFILKNYISIQHISLYMLEDYYTWETEGTHFDKISYPENRTKLWLKEEEYENEYGKIKKYLESIWFYRYELSNFSKLWYECKHNQSYWNHSEIAWFWLWSHSFINNVRYAYTDDFLWYYRFQLDYKETLHEKDIFLEKVMFWLRTQGVKKEIYEKFDQNKINDYIKNGYLEFKNDMLVISDTSISMIDFIIWEII